MTTSKEAKAEGQSYPINRPMSQSWSDGNLFARCWRSGHCRAVALVGMQDVSTGVNSRVYVCCSDMQFSEWKPRIHSPCTPWIAIIVSVAVNVLSFSWSDYVFTFSSRTRSSKTKLESLRISRRAYVRIFFWGSFTDDKKTGTMLEVAVALQTSTWDKILWTSWPVFPSEGVETLFTTSLNLLSLFSCKQVGWRWPHIPQMCRILQSLVKCPFRKQPKHRWFWCINDLLSPIDFEAKAGHFAMPWCSSLQTRHGSLGLKPGRLSKVFNLWSFVWALVLKVFALLGSLSSNELELNRKEEVMGLQAIRASFCTNSAKRLKVGYSPEVSSSSTTILLHLRTAQSGNFFQQLMILLTII